MAPSGGNSAHSNGRAPTTMIAGNQGAHQLLPLVPGPVFAKRRGRKNIVILGRASLTSYSSSNNNKKGQRNKLIAFSFGLERRRRRMCSIKMVLCPLGPVQSSSRLSCSLPPPWPSPIHIRINICVQWWEVCLVSIFSGFLHPCC